jgi:hypothetical protein
MLRLMLAKVYNCFYKFILYFTKNIFVKPSVRPDIRYPALTGYSAGYPVSGFWFSRISGKISIRCIPTFCLPVFN